MLRAYCRLYQFVFRIVTPLLPWRQPEVLTDFGAMSAKLRSMRISKVLVITDAGLIKLGLEKRLIGALANEGIEAVVYDQVVPNPTIGNIEQALALYRKHNLMGIIALGGGSPIDCAKGVGARVARPRKSIQKMRGVLKVLRRMPPFVAIPTTAGTGSETTLACVVTDENTHEKFALNDPALIPHIAVLDALLTRDLPPSITATTGMDALVHAVEAYIGGSNTRKTRRDAIEATCLIFENLYDAYTDGGNLKARAAMQRAAYLAGAAFTRAYVGNVHAVAHTLGGLYGTPHGLANAVILPYVLDAYGEKVTRSLAQLAKAVGIDEGLSEADAAKAFIEQVRALNLRMGIPTKINELKREDIPTLARRALREANPLYPVPVIFDFRQMQSIYEHILA